MEEMSLYLEQISQGGLKPRGQLETFIDEVQALDPDDHLFYQRVFTIAGVEYSPEKKTFWDFLTF